MVTKKTTPSSKKTNSKNKLATSVAAPRDVTTSRGLRLRLNAFFEQLKWRSQNLLQRRPHRSFKRSQRRDYTRSLKLPGYWAFTNHVRTVLWQQKKLFILLVLLYGTLSVVLVGIASQDTYTQLGDTLREISGEVFTGNMGEIAKASLLLVSGVTGAASQELTTPQQIYAAIIFLFTWLTTVWLLRAILSGHKPRLRDGLYNAGAPILPTFLVGLLLLVQLIPVALAAIGFQAASSTGVLDGGIEAMLFWTCASLLASLSLYWMTSTFIALVVITLPGMYPMQAIKTAGDLVIGRRIRILLRLLWLFFTLAVSWLMIMLPIVLFDTWLKGIQPAIKWLPIVPVALLIMSTLTLMWSASYVYLLYRKVVDDDAAPA